MAGLSNDLIHNLSDGACRTIDQLDASMDHGRKEIVKATGRLIHRGLVERVEIGCYQLSNAGKDLAASGEEIKPGPFRTDRGKCRKPRDTMRQRAWQAMRMSGSFTIGDIAMAAAGPNDARPEGNLQKYFRALRHAGYLIELPVRAQGTALTSNGFKRFRLLKDTGLIAPIYRANKGAIFDHNLGDSGEEIPCRAK
ncbi:MAG: hypothetical protein N4A65_01125 [Cohaesibacter sp.]|jgi:hypothetical protein|nr:hypothetical protein [Cohaesibacter sp.]